MEEPVSFLDALQRKYSDEDYRVLFSSLICQERDQEIRQEQENASHSPGTVIFLQVLHNNFLILHIFLFIISLKTVRVY